jgi:hypothetical protein
LECQERGGNNELLAHTHNNIKYSKVNQTINRKNKLPFEELHPRSSQRDEAQINPILEE